MMELNSFTQAIRPPLEKKDFLDSALDAIDRVFVREGFSTEEPDAATLERQIEVANRELEKLVGIEKKIHLVRENFDSMNDRDLTRSINEIEEIFSPSELSLATETFNPRIRHRALLATESLEEKAKYGLIALFIAALLKVIAWLIQAISDQAKQKHKGKKKDKGLTPTQEKTEEEINELAKERAAEQVARKYAINTEVVREQMMRLYNYSSDGNLRAAGGKGAGAAAEVASLIVDKVNELNVDVVTKETIRDNAFKCIFALIDNNVPIGHFAFNEATRHILAADFVDFAKRDFQGPISKLMSVFANLLPDNESAHQLWYKDKQFLNNEVRLITRHVGEDILTYLDSMEYTSRDLGRFFNKFGKSNEFDYDTANAATINNFALNQKVKFDSPSTLSSFIENINSILHECSIQLTTTSAISSPMRFTEEVQLKEVQTERGIYYDFPDAHENAFVGKAEYTAITSMLNGLSGEDAVATFAKWFYTYHGDYDKHDTIESRLWYLTANYGANQKQAKQQLTAIKNEFQDLYDTIRKVKVSRDRNKVDSKEQFGVPVFVYDVLVPYGQTQMRLHGGGVTDHTMEKPLGKRVEDLIRTYRASIAGWGSLMKVTDHYVSIAKKIDIEQP